MVGETAKKLGHFLLVTVLLLLMMMMIFSPHTTRWGATASSIQLDNGTRTALDYQGRIEELELLFDSEISRMLADYQSVTSVTNDPNKPAVSGCGRPPKYASCLPQENGNQPQKCETYTRGCK
ncbi:hypothetical protein I3843_04G048800 [Carya illinoinensis]|uniref:Rapid ALkalinization Factor n=1 Tax=Carya illinoinensis TaxID=32201 RepID=A0A8T1QQL3_CARIL|nr:hypothetical protein CIPAW_04G053600 [Carya illinoinensis]KAG7982365.1 hypothetical protein I3843_04G048800 [Carya illinoinensis]